MDGFSEKKKEKEKGKGKEWTGCSALLVAHQQGEEGTQHGPIPELGLILLAGPGKERKKARLASS